MPLTAAAYPAAEPVFRMPGVVMPCTVKIPPMAMKPSARKRTRYWAIWTAAMASIKARAKARAETTVTMAKC